MANPKITFTTDNGIFLEFEVIQAPGTWNDVPGIYVFCKKQQDYFPLYVGQASSFKARFSNHEKWDSAMRQGMTHILATIVRNQGDRDKIEATLIRMWKPKLNTLLK